MTIKVTIKGDIRFPDFDLSNDLKNMADRIIIAEIVAHIQNRENIDGQRYDPLADSTVRQKRRRGVFQSSPSHQLIGHTGKLHRSFYSQKAGKNKVKILIRGDRKRVAEILQVEGVKSKKYGRRKFNFFGINENMEKESVNFMRERIRRLTRGR